MKKLYVIITILLFILLLVACIAIFSGVVPVRPFANWSQDYRIILFRVRLPRIILAVIAGAGLAVSGVIFQGLLRNPLADPYILGTSSGATLGITTVISLGLAQKAGPFGLPAVGFIFALGTITLVYAIASSRGHMSVETLLLSGVIVSSFLSALIMLIMSLARRETFEIIFWLMGSLSETNTVLIKIAGSCVFIGIIFMFFFWRDLNILSLGEKHAHHLGVEVERTKRFLFVIASIVVGAVVSVTGMIGFVGLIIPHIVRMITGPDHRFVIPVSALSGSIFLIICDTVARTVVAPIEVPVGVITALCGAPFFIFLLCRKKVQGYAGGKL